MISSPMLGRQR